MFGFFIETRLHFNLQSSPVHSNMSPRGDRRVRMKEEERRHQTFRGPTHLHVSPPPSEAQQLLVLAGDEVDGGVLQQGREDEQQTDRHPDVDGFNVGHLRGEKSRLRCVQVYFSS